MDVRILGPLEVWEGSEQLVIDSPRQRSLLALLAVHANAVVSVDRVVDELWGESPPDSAESTVRYHVSKLRSSLGDAAKHVATRSPGYVLELPAEAIDVHRFESMAAEGRGLIATEPDRAARMLVDALAMWRGAPLAEFTYETFARGEIIRLEELRLGVMEDRIDADLASGREVDLVGELEALVEEHPLRERLWGQLMTALYRTGRQAEALRAFQQAKDALGEIGIEPSDELRAIEEQVLLQDPVLQAVRKPVRHHNLPERVSSFVGREVELEELRRLVADHRLVTLTGLGGLGKTSLAIEAIRPAVAEFADGIWMIPLSDIVSPDLIPERMADGVGLEVQDAAAILDRLEAYLSSRETVLLLDACEQHIDSVATLIERLLGGAPRLRILATSREPLQVGGEARYELGVLDCGGEDAEAIRLFIERAQLVDRDFEETPAITATVSRLCSRLAGIPLAIELAAARLGSLTLEQIADRLDRQMALLVRGRGGRSQHDSMQATLDWSHDLLDPVEQTVFRRLAVFQRDFSLQAVEQVCSNGLVEPTVVADVLARLVDASLLVLDRQRGRFEMLDPVRQYAAGHLQAADEGDAVRLMHCNYFSDLAGRVDDGLFGADDVGWLRVGEQAEPDYVAALDWALANEQPELAVATTANLVFYWNLTGRAAIEDRFLGVVLELARRTPSADSVRVIAHASYVGYSRGDEGLSRSLAEEAMEQAAGLEDQGARSLALVRLGAITPDLNEGITLTRQAIQLADKSLKPMSRVNLVMMLCSHFDETGELITEAEAIANELMTSSRHSGSLLLEGCALTALSFVAWTRGEVAEARDYAAKNLLIDRQLGMNRWIAMDLWLLSEYEMELGNIERAATYLREADPAHREIWGARALRFEGLISIANGERQKGLATLSDALAAFIGGADDQAAILLFDIASLCFEAGRHEASCRIYAAVEEWNARAKLRLAGHHRRRLDEHRNQLHASLGSERFAEVWEEGVATSISDAASSAIATLEEMANASR